MSHRLRLTNIQYSDPPHYRSQAAEAADHCIGVLQVTGHRLQEVQVKGCRSYRSQADGATDYRLKELQVTMLKELHA